jgi:hypothetical protein
MDRSRLWPPARLHDLPPLVREHARERWCVSLYVVQGPLGHSPARMTQRYAHLAPQTLLDAAEIVASVISTDAAA